MTSPAEYALGLTKALNILSGNPRMLPHTASAGDGLLRKINLMIGQTSLALIVDTFLI